MSSESNYQKLPGGSRKAYGLADPAKYRLWIGEDHLLYVRSSPYFSEKARRFYFKDIRALVTTRTSQGKIANIILGFFAAAFGLPTLLGVSVGGWSTAAATIMGGITLLFALLLAVNAAMGPTCRVTLHTGVTAEDIICLGRINVARRTIGIIKTRIASMQGGVTPDDLAGPGAAPAGPPRGSGPAAGGVSSPPVLRREPGKWHLALFAMLLITGISTGVDIFFQHSVKNHIDTVTALPLLAAMIVALVKQRNSDLPSNVKTITMLSLVLVLIHFIVGQIFMSAYAVANLEQIGGFGGMGGMYNMKFQSPGFVVYFAVFSAGRLIIGMMGLSFLNQARADGAGRDAAGQAGPAPDPEAQPPGVPYNNA